MFTVNVTYRLPIVNVIATKRAVLREGTAATNVLDPLVIYEYLSLRRTGEPILILKLFYVHVQKKMRIQGREKGSKLICFLALVIVITTIVYTAAEGFSAFLVILLFAGVLTILLGAIVYLGHAGILAGFNTMSEKERKEYDMEKVTSFIGIGLAVTGFVPFFAAFFMMIAFDGGTSFAVFFLLFMVMILFVAFYPASKKFKANP